MSLGLRKYLLVALKWASPAIPLLALIVGAVLLVAFPIFDPRKTYFSENNLMTNAASVGMAASDFNVNPGKYLRSQSVLVVNSSRGGVSDRLLVVVNSDERESVMISLAVAKVLGRAPYLSADVEFQFLPFTKKPEMRWESAFYRAAVVLNVSCSSLDVCVNTLGTNGLQPNLDIVNVLVANLHASGLRPSLLCQNRPVNGPREVFDALSWVAQFVPPKIRLPFADWNSHLGYLAAAAQMPASTWLPIRERGIHTLTLSSNLSSAGQCPQGQEPTGRVAMALERLLRSLNNLSERPHHSFFIWFAISNSVFVDFEASQLILFIFGAGLVGKMYNLLGEGRKYSYSLPLIVLWLSAASILGNEVPWAGVVAAIPLIVVVKRREACVGTVATLTTWLCMMMSINPALAFGLGACASFISVGLGGESVLPRSFCVAASALVLAMCLLWVDGASEVLGATVALLTAAATVGVSTSFL